MLDCKPIDRPTNPNSRLMPNQRESFQTHVDIEDWLESWTTFLWDRHSPRGSYLPLSLHFVCKWPINSYQTNWNELGIQGARINKNTPIITHLLFGGGCFMFFKDIDQKVRLMKNIRSMYETTSYPSFKPSKINFFL